MRRGCIFCRACSGRGRGSNCCRLYTLSLLLNPVPQELKNELLPPPTHSFTRRDSNGDPRGEPAGYGLQQGVSSPFSPMVAPSWMWSTPTIRTRWSSASPQSYGCTRFWSIRPFHRQRRLHLRYGGEKEERDDSAIWCNKLVDIQKQYKIISNGQEKDSVVDLAETIIDPWYANMKEDDLNTWEVPLNLAYITYAAKDAYACYDMYRQILDMRACLLPVTDEYTDSRSVMIKRARKV